MPVASSECRNTLQPCQYSRPRSFGQSSKIERSDMEMQMLSRIGPATTVLGLIGSFAAMVAVSPAIAENPDSVGKSLAAEHECSALAGMAIENGKVISARIMTRSQVDGHGAKSSYPSSGSDQNRIFCRVEAVSTPAPGSNIKIEVWLPVAIQWNGKLLGTSNGGLEKIVHSELGGGLDRGYATAAMELEGNPFEGPELYRFGIDHPELVKNWSYRGLHLMTVSAKTIVSRFYNKSPSISIFSGYSGAGFQAIGAASRFPGDYDGIIVGTPAINLVNMGLGQGFRYVTSHRSTGSAIPPEALPMLADEVLAQCDGIDGLLDGIIDDPRRCRVNFRRMICQTARQQDCFSPQQVATLEALYGGLRDPRTKQLLYPGFAPGAELSPGAQVRIAENNKASFINDDTPGPLVWALGSDFSALKWKSFDFGTGGDSARAALAPYENTDPNFSAFAARGGKIIFYGGWAESNLNPVDFVNFYERLFASGGPIMGSTFTRLFMAPGMYHGGTGPGPNSFGQKLAAAGTSADNDIVMAMDRWLTEGVAPERLIATKFAEDRPSGRILRTRPLCAYPKVARWKGIGTIDSAENFVCEFP